MIDRRELLHRAAGLMGGALSTGAMAGVLAGCVSTPPAALMPALSAMTPPPPPTAAGVLLSGPAMRAATAMADRVIPRTDTPGALDVGAPAYIDKMVAGFYAQREKDIVVAGLAQVDADAQALAGKPFADLSETQQMALLTRYDSEQVEQGRRTLADPQAPHHFFRFVKELTVLAYCTSERGAKALMRYELNPGPFRGDVPVSEIGKAWAI